MESATLTSPRGKPGLLARLRAVPERAWARSGFALLCVGAAIGYLVYPTYPNYDSAYSLIWGRELLDGALPSFDAYRTPTEHPLAVAFGAVLVAAGRRGAAGLAGGHGLRLLPAGRRRLPPGPRGVHAVGRRRRRRCWSSAAWTTRSWPRAATSTCPYLAMVAWAAALETEKPRRGGAVWVLLDARGPAAPRGLDPARRLLAVVPAAATERPRVAIAAIALTRCSWALTDLLATGDPLFSLRHTSSLANDLQRTKPASEAPGFALHSLTGTLKWPVLVGALLGLVLALVFARRRAAILLALTASGLVTFGAIAVAGLSVIDRYLAVTALGLLVFAGFAIAGFTVLPAEPPARAARGSPPRCVVALGGAAFTATHLHPGYIDRELTTRRELRQELARLVTTPAFALATAAARSPSPTTS